MSVIVVIDPNVLVSGLLSDQAPPARIVDLIVAGRISVAADFRILDEYERVLSRPKFGIRPEHIQALLEQIRAAGIQVFCEPMGVALPDPDDEKFLEAALASKAEYLITGNLKHFPFNRRSGVRVVSPRQFVDLIRTSKP